MLEDLVILNGLFDYLVKVNGDVRSVNVLDCSIRDRYNNDLRIKINFEKFAYTIIVNSNFVEIENTDTYNNKCFDFKNTMELIEILENFRKGIDIFE